MADASFDVVSKVDRQEVDNALNQTGKELSQRFDFRGTNATIEWAGEAGVTLQADTEERVAAALDVFKEKLIKRGISVLIMDGPGTGEAIRFRGHCTCVEDHNIGGIAFPGRRKTAFGKLRFQCRAIGLGRAASEILNKETHRGTSFHSGTLAAPSQAEAASPYT